MKRSMINISLCAAAMFLLASSAFAVAPTMNYQGYLTESGQPVTGQRDITFSIWNHPDVGLGTQLWTETQAGVPVQDGVFSVQLGETNSISNLVITQSQGFLQIEVAGAGGPISPRTPLTSVPYSFRVQTVDGALGGEISGDLRVDGSISTGPGSCPPDMRAVFRFHQKVGGSSSFTIDASLSDIMITAVYADFGFNTTTGSLETGHFSCQLGTEMVIHVCGRGTVSWMSGCDAGILVPFGSTFQVSNLMGLLAPWITVTGYYPHLHLHLAKDGSDCSSE